MHNFFIDRPMAALEELLAPFPVELRQVSTSVGGAGGRAVVCSRAVGAGELLLRSRAVGATCHRRHEPHVCACCLRFSEDAELPVACGGGCDGACGVWYCSAVCAHADGARHAAHCGMLARARRTKSIKKEEYSFVRLLLRMLGVCAAYRSKASDGGGVGGSGGSIFAVGKRSDSGGGDAFDGNFEDGLEKSDSYAPSGGLEHVMALMADEASIPGFKRRQRQREGAVKAFLALLPATALSATTAGHGGVKSAASDVAAAAAVAAGEEEGGGGLAGTQRCERDAVALLTRQLRWCPEFLSSRTLVALLSRQPLNEFGVCYIDGETVGGVCFPAAAMLNHSCVPSAALQLERQATVAFYATRDLALGEEVTFCYTGAIARGISSAGDDDEDDVKALTRQELLQESWGIACCCDRCRLDDAGRASSIGQTGDGPALAALRAKITAFDQHAMCEACRCFKVPDARRWGGGAGGHEEICGCGTFHALPAPKHVLMTDGS